MSGRVPALPVGPADRVATESKSAAWSWAEVAHAAGALATRIDALLVDGGRPRVGHVFELTAEGIVAAHAVARTDAMFAPAHPGWTDEQAARYNKAVDPSVLLVSPGLSWPGSWNRTSVSLPGFGPVDLLLPLDPPSRSSAAPLDTDVLVSTSGSGGAPRTVCHSWSGLLANASAANGRSGETVDDVTLATLAWAHIGGLGVVLRSAASGGRLVIGPPRFDARVVLDAIERHGVTQVSLVPVMLERLMDTSEAPPPSLRYVLVGGAGVSPRLEERVLRAGWPIALTYGLTEAGSQVSTAPPGTASGDVDLRANLLDGFELRLEEDGELAIRGPSVMVGYLEDHEGERDGWHRTGDLAEECPDGELVLVGRRAERLVTGGTNVDPVGIENALLDHPDVEAACVVGTPDPRWGDLVTALIVAANADTPASDREAALDAWSRDCLDGPRVPRRWLFVDSLPMTATGKLDREGARSLAVDRSASPTEREDAPC